MSSDKSLRIRTLTAGVALSEFSQLDRIEKAIAVLNRSRKAFEAAGYEVQTLRIATNGLMAGSTGSARDALLPQIETLDRVLRDAGVIMSVGPLLDVDRDDPELAAWAVQLVQRTQAISFSVVIASPGGVHGHSAIAAARIMSALAPALPEGAANFRFAAAANIPAGTPFFPVAWHQGADSLAIGLESASLVEQAFANAQRREAGERLQSLMNAALRPVAVLGSELAQREGRAWLGIDSSPAPMKDRSIAAAIEAFTHVPFGSASTLEACSVITAAIKSLQVKTCGYSGLMLPVLEDPLLAQRAGEGRFGVRDLLLYSSVCGTGLDVVPIPGDTSVEVLSALLRDVGALSARLNKALSARLFLVPGRKVGEMARFNDPLLTDCVVMRAD